jgi:hypothetical protein
MRNPCLALTTILTLATASANAADLSEPNVSTPPMATGSAVANSAFFLGLGASGNWTHFGDQHVYAIELRTYSRMECCRLPEALKALPIFH